MHTYTTPDPITVEVRNAAGSVHIALTETDQTTVDVELHASGALGFVDEIVRAFGGRRAGDGEDQATARSSRWWEAPSGAEASDVLARVRVDLASRDDGDTLIVDTEPAGRGWRTAFAVRITAPAESGIRVNSQSSDVTVSGVASRLDIRTASGDVLAADVREGARIQTASGDTRLASIDGELNCRSASGDIEVTAAGGDATLHTTSGGVTVQAATGSIEVRTVSGDVRIADVTRGLARITAVSGDIEVGVHPGTLAAISLSTISGTTRSDLTVSDSRSPAPPAPSVSETDVHPVAEPAESTAPTLEIQARTTSGDIRLRRSVGV